MTGLVSIIALIIGILFFIGIFFNEESYVFLAEKIFLILFFVALVIGIIIFVPWLLIIGIVIVGFIYFINKKNNVIDKNNNVNQNNNDTLSLSYNQEPSDFQRQLQENTKTPKQVEDENWSKEKEQITLIATNDFSAIKRALLDKAKNGQYTDLNGQKCISLNYYCSYLLSCIDRQYSRNPTGRMGTSSYRSNEKVSYHIGKTKKYDLYLSVIKELSLEDNININPFFTERDVPHNCENRIPMPYTFTNKYGIGVSSHQIKVYLECFIQY